MLAAAAPVYWNRKPILAAYAAGAGSVDLAARLATALQTRQPPDAPSGRYRASLLAWLAHTSPRPAPPEVKAASSVHEGGTGRGALAAVGPGPRVEQPRSPVSDDPDEWGRPWVEVLRSCAALGLKREPPKAYACLGCKRSFDAEWSLYQHAISAKPEGHPPHSIKQRWEREMASVVRPSKKKRGAPQQEVSSDAPRQEVPCDACGAVGGWDTGGVLGVVCSGTCALLVLSRGRIAAPSRSSALDLYQ